jgi:hypothetical protein
MRTLTLVLALVLAMPALADAPKIADGDERLPHCLTVKLTKDTKFRLTVDPKQHFSKPEYMGFKISHKSTGVMVETKGDPMLFFGGKFVGYWPYKHVTYALRNGVTINAHADQKNGNPHSFEIFHIDGTMTKITKADTTKPQVVKYGKLRTAMWKKLYYKRYFWIDLE